jgi:tetratricopeptide (TPR) repeat protein
VRPDKKTSYKAEKKAPARAHRQGVVGYSKKSALLEEAITHMNTGKYGRSSAALKELLALDPQNTEARRLFATLHLRLGSLVTAREAFESLANEAIGRQDYWLAESLLREYLAAGPRCIPFLELLAHVHEEKGDEMAAVAELGKAVEILLEDPDPDNPQKPAQIYSKIRQLAPASPVAFQFASLFDIRTGEIRISQCAAQRQTTPSEMPNSQPLQGTTSTAETLGSSDVISWEQMDEAHPAAAPPSADLSSIDAYQAPTDLSPASAVVESTPWSPEPSCTPLTNDKSEGDAAPFLNEPAWDARQAIPTLRGESELDQAAQAETSASMPTIDESPSPSSIAFEPSADPSADIPPSHAAASEPSSGPSRMPWEHVADAGLQIVEPEPSIQTPPASEPVPQTSSESLAWPATPEGTMNQASFRDLNHDEVVQPEGRGEPEALAMEQPTTVTTADPIPELPPPASPPQSPSTSFSWNAIFDTAWKFAIGSTTPSSAEAIKERAETVTHGLEKELEAVKQVPAAPEPTGRVDAQPLSPTTPLERETVESSSEQSPSSQDNAWTEPPAFNTNSPAGASLPEAALPHAEPIQESALSPAPPLPVSFTLVEDAHVIPQPSAVEPTSSAPTEASVPPVSLTLEPTPVIETPMAAESPSSVETSQAIVAPPTEAPQNPTSPVSPAPWNTGEVAVQPHRPSKKKKKWEKDPVEATEAPAAPSAFDAQHEPIYGSEQTWEPLSEHATETVVEEIIQKPVNTRPEWAQASDTITLSPPVDAPPAWHETTADSQGFTRERSSSAAASAVDVLFSSSARIEREPYIQTKDRLSSPKRRPWILSRLARLRIAIVSFVWSCFSTTRAFALFCASLVVLSFVVAALAVGAVGLAWIVMEEPPSSRYQNLTTSPQRLITDHERNGYLLLLGFDAPVAQNPVQAGYERKAGDTDMADAQACMTIGQATGGSSNTAASAHLVQGWFKGTDPLAQLKLNGQTIKSMVTQEATALERYQRWMSMSFDDWGYGQIFSPNCGRILLAHQLFLLDGFSQDHGTGLSRLEKDMESWRAALGQSKTLMVKMLAATAIQDDVTIVSGLLARPETDAATVGRLANVVRPLDQLELSVRWPMQSHFVWATHHVSAELKKERAEDHPFYVSLAAAMPLPIQRRANAYAEYYDAANKAVAEGRYTNLPQASNFLRTSANSAIDYLANPLEHLIGIEPLPLWDPYVGQMVETDAHLRLASLQVLVRRGAQEKDVLARLAKAGQAYYDPFTGLPMLVNQQKRLLYSVGRDGKDQDGDRQHDVVVAIPVVPGR